MGTEAKESFGAWLRREMLNQGYEVDGSRAGGRTRLAKESGVSLSIISRTLNENRVPEVKALRAIGMVLGRSLGEMLVVAGVAESKELHQSVGGTATAEDSATVTKSPVIPEEPPPDLPRVLAARYLNFSATERAILWLPGATPAEREQLVSIWQAIHKLTTDAAAAQSAKDEIVPGTVSEMKRRG